MDGCVYLLFVLSESVCMVLYAHGMCLFLFCFVLFEQVVIGEDEAAGGEGAGTVVSDHDGNDALFCNIIHSSFSLFVTHTPYFERWKGRFWSWRTRKGRWPRQGKGISALLVTSGCLLEVTNNTQW